MGSKITIEELALVYQDLLETKAPLLAKTASYSIFKSGVLDHGAKLRGYTKAEDSPPLIDELKAADKLHDDSARMVYRYCTAMKASGFLDPESEQLLGTLLETFVPNLSGIRVKYESEAAAAQKKRAALEQLETKLKSFTIAPSLSLYEVLNTHINAAEKIGELMSKRASASQAQAAKDTNATATRVKAISLLGKLQNAIQDEVKFNGLDPRLPNQIFAYWEQMQNRAQDKAHHQPKSRTNQTRN